MIMATSSSLGIGDLALTWSVETNNADLSLIDSDIASDQGLLTAVLLSLFLDRRAEDDDVPPSGDARDRRGWWADAFLEPEGDKIGSRLWLLDRSKIIGETTKRAEEYVREALAWMIVDRVVARIDVEVATNRDRMAFAVTLARPNRDDVTFKFQTKWDHLTL